MVQWKPIIGYEGIYEVSDTGDVRTVEGKITYTEHHGVRTWKQRILRLKTDRDGYKRVALYKDGKPKDFLVHRLVAQAFCYRPHGKNIINHIDGNPDNNIPSNLEWCDHRENLLHAFKIGLNRSPKGVSLTDTVTGDRYEFYSLSEASRFLGRSASYVSGLVKKGKQQADGYAITIL